MTLGTILQSLDRTRAKAGHWAARHPRRLTAVAVSALASFAVTAFGIAPMAPDAADLPQRLLSEDVRLLELAPQLDALANHDLALWRNDTVRSADTADSLLKRLGVNDPLAARHLRGDRDARRLFDGRSGKMVRARAQADGSLVELVARFPALDDGLSHSHFTRLTLSKHDGLWHTRLETAPLTARARVGSGTVRSTLFAALDDANLPDAVGTQLVEMFGNDIDFRRELRRGDTFSVVYEALFADDQPVTWNAGVGTILAAEFNNAGQTHRAVLFEHAGKSAYFDFNGQNKRRAFLANPLEFSRMTSGFEMRLHPIARVWKQHLGVDYGAPTGTPVRVVGDGVVEFAGQQRGYGNLVKVKHSQERSTVYAHLNSIGVRVGQRVEQGQNIGTVGATGYATGPHLHFEFLVNGDHRDPVEIARASETLKVDTAARPRFQQTALAMQDHLAVAQTLRGYQGQGE
ncbi:metalloendopeptidase-like membrane protein [Burkholderiales bacterium JOSHI_001]|nr:metalloendopeptidase-like membrane protein [Burkholderiales bacterium JOSHI_001]